MILLSMGAVCVVLAVIELVGHRRDPTRHPRFQVVHLAVLAALLFALAHTGVSGGSSINYGPPRAGSPPAPPQ